MASLTHVVEDYRSGWPQFAALTSAHPAFRIFRRFASIRTRLLYLKQDEIAVLEKRLDSIDDHERSELFLGNLRRDRNVERKRVISDLEKSLSEYGENHSLRGRTTVESDNDDRSR